MFTWTSPSGPAFSAPLSRITLFTAASSASIEMTASAAKAACGDVAAVAPLATNASTGARERFQTRTW